MKSAAAFVPTESAGRDDRGNRRSANKRMGEVLRVEGATLPEEGCAVRVDAAGTPVAVYRVGGRLYALEARCPHVGGPLDQGPLEKTRVTCPWHGSMFDVREGTLHRGPATTGAPAFQVRQEGATLVLERA